MLIAVYFGCSSKAVEANKQLDKRYGMRKRCAVAKLGFVVLWREDKAVVRMLII